jgi:hypothetical protein
MADEATIKAGLQVKKGNIDYLNRPIQFTADVDGTKGPTPGAVSCTTAGTDIDLSELTTPGWCVLRNIDPTNFVSVGVWHPQNNEFFPFLELLPGEQAVIRLSRNFTQEFFTGTGTTGPGNNTLRIKANVATCVVVVDAFEK